MNLQELKIGNIVTNPNLVLAPMSGVTNSSFRKLMREENPGALGLVVTEFVSIEGLTRGNKRTVQMLKFEEIERPISIQIFGYDIDRMVDAAKMVEETGADIVDINCGCPVPRVVKRGGGCELMRQETHLEKILTNVVKAVNIPVTLKIRAGWDENSRNAVEIAKMAENSGIKMIAVHGRTRQQLYRGLADWDIVKQVCENVKIPVVGSGDVVSPEFAKFAFASGVSGLMIGRGAMENPFIFKEIYEEMSGKAQNLEGKKTKYPSEVLRVLLRYYDLQLEEIGPKGTCGKMKQLISQATRRLPNGAAKRRVLCMLNSAELIREELLRWQEELINYQDSSSYLDQTNLIESTQLT